MPKMWSRMYWVLIFFITITACSAQNCLNLTGTSKIVIEPVCYSNDVIVTRYFYIENEETCAHISIKENDCPYLFAVGAELEPQLISVTDNFGWEYQKEFYFDQVDAYFVYFNFPKNAIDLAPKQKYILASVYRSKNMITQNTKNKELHLRSIHIGITSNRVKLEEVKIKLPDCFLFRTVYLDSIPKGYPNSYGGNDIVITYEMQDFLEGDSQNMSNQYLDPTISYREEFDLYELLFIIVPAILGYAAFLKIRERKKGNK